MRPLRILLLGDYPDDPRLGSSKVPHELQRQFESLGHGCDTIFAADIGGPRSRQVRQLVAPWRAGIAVRRRMAQATYDVIDAASAEALWVGAARRVGALRGCAVVCRSNGIEHLNYARMIDDARAGLSRKPWTRRIWYPTSRLSQVAMAARLADAMIVLNDGDRQYVLARRWQPAERLAIVPHGLSSAFLATDPGADAPRGAGLLFCGSWDNVKGVADLVRAFEALHAAGRRYPLTVLGPGLPAEAVLRAFGAGVRDHVTVLPRSDEAVVIDACRRHDALVWPSTYEGFGLVVIEAMSQRLPVVATPSGCAGALVADGVTGMSVPPRDPAAIAGAVSRLMDDRALRDRIGAAARSAVAGMTWRATAEATLEVYARALNGASR